KLDHDFSSPLDYKKKHLIQISDAIPQIQLIVLGSPWEGGGVRVEFVW
ncbi:9102_t:CDS:2, partial [Rhizophagus irregularis]